MHAVFICESETSLLWLRQVACYSLVLEKNQLSDEFKMALEASTRKPIDME